MIITPIICKNNPTEIVGKIQDYLNNKGSIASMCVIDTNNSEVVILVSTEKINDSLAKMWWDGYTHALKG